MTVRLRKTPAGSAYWQADFMGPDPDLPAPAMKRYRPSLGPEIRTKAEAEAEEARVRVFIEQEAARHRSGAACAKPERKTVATLAERWFNYNSTTGEWKPSTVRLNRIILDKWLLPELGNVALTELHASRIDAFKEAVARRGRGAKWNRTVLGTLAAMCAQGVKWRDLPANPCAQVTQFKAPAPDFDWYTREETEVWLDKARELYPRLYPLFLCLFRAGLREGEAFALEQGDVDFHGMRLHVRRSITRGRVGETDQRVTTDPKSRKARFVDLAPDLAAVLREIRGPHRLVFPNAKGEPYTREQILFPWWRITNAAGLRVLTPHDARHSYASQLVSAGAPLVYVQHQLGHSTIRMTERYAHLAPQGQRWVSVLSDGGTRARHTEDSAHEKRR